MYHIQNKVSSFRKTFNVLCTLPLASFFLPHVPNLSHSYIQYSVTPEKSLTETHVDISGLGIMPFFLLECPVKLQLLVWPHSKVLYDPVHSSGDYLLFLHLCSKAHHFPSPYSSDRLPLYFIISCIIICVTVQALNAVYTPLHTLKKKAFSCNKFSNIYRMYEIWVEYLMIPQGQLEKGSYVRNTEGKQKLNIYIRKLVGIHFLKTNLEKI